LDEAATAYEQVIKLHEKRGDIRGVAVNKGQLGTVRQMQHRYTEALQAHSEARDTFAGLGEPRTVATAWHLIGLVHRAMREFDAAEQAYRQALAISVRQKNRTGQADSLIELGNLYDDMERLEEAVTFYRQAANIYAKLRNLEREGRARNNMANALIKLERYDEARRVLQRAIECKQPYGHAALPWTTWMILHNLEQATGNPAAAMEARQKAIQAYLAYRRDGGENQDIVAELCTLVAQAIQQNETTQLDQALTQYLSEHPEPWATAMIPKLQAILRGSREAALAEDAALYYIDAAELLLLLERL
jgi:tetratricopeptide (TPR) repeat protein